MRKDLIEAIERTAKATAAEVLSRQRTMHETNLYRATERLLYNYKAMREQVENTDAYMLAGGGARSGSITSAHTGTGYKDRETLEDERQRARALSYMRTKARFDEIDDVVQQFAHRREFIVIRMYYFNETAAGIERAEGLKRYTFEDIQYELAQNGLDRSERTIRGWRTRIVQDMAVRLFGIEGALSLETRKLLEA